MSNTYIQVLNSTESERQAGRETDNWSLQGGFEGHLMLHKLPSTNTMFLHKVIKHSDDSHSEKEKYHNLSPLNQLNRYVNRLFEETHI